MLDENLCGQVEEKGKLLGIISMHSSIMRVKYGPLTVPGTNEFLLKEIPTFLNPYSLVHRKYLWQLLLNNTILSKERSLSDYIKNTKSPAYISMMNCIINQS